MNLNAYSSTMTVQVSVYVIPSTVTDAVIIVLPVPSAVTTPLLTVATLLLAEVHVTAVPSGTPIAALHHILKTA